MHAERVEPRRTLALRRAVMRPGTPLDEPFPYDVAPGALHFAVLDDDVVVGACMIAPEAFPLRPDTAPAWRLRGMATDPGHRGRGVGATLITGVLADLAGRGAAILWCNARVEAVGFYLRCGFRVEGEEFVPDDLPIPHRRMWRAVEPAAGTTSSGPVERSDDRSRGA